MSPQKKVASKKKTAKKKSAKDVTAKKISKVTPKKPEVKIRKTKKIPQLLRGMKDILPKHSDMWLKLYHTAENIATAYGFSFVETPILEEASLFVRSIGKGTDVVDKEMYIFEDRDGSKIGLRPENTAGIARMYIGHGMQTESQPVKVWYNGPMFRHNRPQAGRFRQFHQFGCETLGKHEPVADAEIINIAYNFFRDLNIETQVYINSIGTLEERHHYIIELVGYLRTKRSFLCDNCKKRINKNPLRVLDCKEESCQSVIEEAPQILDWLNEDSKSFFMSVLEHLDELEIPYILKPTLVRGLDYYTDTVFEFFCIDEDEGSQSALGAGGRYNMLVSQLGGQPTPACGFSIGLERVFTKLRKQLDVQGEILPKETYSKFFFAHLGDQSRRRVLKIIEDLRREKIVVLHNLGKSSLKGQLELANKFGVSHTIILGQKELQDGTIIIRDMESGIQEIIDQKKLKAKLTKLME